MSRLLLLAAICAAAMLPEKPAAPAANQESPPTGIAPAAIDVQYARAKLRLAEANLERLRAMNRKLARTVPASVVAEHEYGVAVAREGLRQAESAGAADGFSRWLEQAEADYRLAHGRWQSAAAVNRQSSTTIDAQDVARYWLRSEVCRLQLARGKALAGASPQQQLAWRVELLGDQVQRMQEDALRLSPLTPRTYSYFYYPLWW